MFEKILQWIRELWNKMIGTNTLKQSLGVDIALSAAMAEALQTWSNLYTNQAPWVTGDVQSLNLAAAIAGEIARAVTIEMKAEVTGSGRALFLQKQLDLVLPKLRGQVERGCALGGLMLKPYVQGKALAVDFVQADQFYPVSFDGNGNVTACVFSEQRQVGNYWYTRLEYHSMTAAGCEIKNMAFRSTSQDALGNQCPLVEVDAWKDLLPEATITGIDRPLFGYFRYPLANNIDTASPLGVSCYSRAVDLIEQADKQWSDLLWEFESGNRALYVDVMALEKDADGNRKQLPLKRLYRTLNGSGNVNDEDMYHEWTPSLREVNYLNGLDAILRRIEFECGLAYGTLSNPQTVDKTATELKISQQRSYATVTDTQKALENALNELLYAMDVWATLGKLAPAGSYTAVYDFDDSVIVDKDAQFKQDLQLVGSGIMGKVEFRMRNFGEDEATAKEKLAAIAQEDIYVPEDMNPYAKRPAQAQA